PFDPESSMGPLVSREHTDRVTRYLADGARAGSVLAGGQRIRIEDSDCYVEPTILAGLPAGNSVLREEIFGPVLALIPFRARAAPSSRARALGRAGHGRARPRGGGSAARGPGPGHPRARPRPDTPVRGVKGPRVGARPPPPSPQKTPRPKDARVWVLPAKPP